MSNTVLFKLLGDESSAVHAINRTGRAMDRLERKTSTFGPMFSQAGGQATLAITAVGGAMAALPAVAGFALAAIPALFGGIGIAAAAQSEVVKSAFTGLKDHVVGTVKELAKPFEPVLVHIADMARSTFDNISPALGGIFEKVAPMVDQLGGALLKLVEGFIGGGGLQKALDSMQPVIDAISTGIANMGPAISGFFENLSGGSGGAAAGVTMLFDAVNWLIPALGSVLGFLARWSSIVVPLGLAIAAFAIGMKVATLAVAAYNTILVIWSGITKVVAAAQWLLNAALSANPIGLIIIAIAALVAAIVWLWNNNEGFRNFIIAAWEGIKVAIKATVDAVVAVWNWLVNAGKSVVDWIVNAWNTVVNTFNSVKDRVVNAIIAMHQGIVNIVGNVIGFVMGLPGRILGALGNVGSLLYNAGADIIRGLMNGVTGMVSSLYSTIKNALSGLVSAAKHALGIGSPSKVFADEIGKWIPEGLALGITHNLGPVTSAVATMADTSTGATVGRIQAAARGGSTSGGGLSISFSGDIDGALASAFMGMVRQGKIQLQATR